MTRDELAEVIEDLDNVVHWLELQPEDPHTVALVLRLRRKLLALYGPF